MLDSNSLAGGGNYVYSRPHPTDPGKSVIHYAFADKKKITYERKTFALWNFLLQKRVNKDFLVYFGIDNIFNHRDDDRAFGGRVYRFGVNMKFGYQPPKEGEPQSTVSPSAAGTEKTTEPLRKDGSGQKPMADTVAKQDDFFITKPFDTAKKRGVEVIGDYRARWNSHGGTNRPAATASATTDISDAAKNMLDRSEHGFEQRLRLGINARIGDNTNLTLIGSASGAGGVDTAHEISSSKGLNHQRLERVDITQHVKKWDFSIGRLKEFMGVTGYWFGKEFDGARAVWTSGRSQVRIGYGDFGHSTGIVDSPYTRATRELFYRAPTAAEFIGYQTNEFSLFDKTKEEIVPSAGENINFAQQIAAASTKAEKYAIVRRLIALMKKAYGEDAFKKDKYYIDVQFPVQYYNGPKYLYKDSQGHINTRDMDSIVRANLDKFLAIDKEHPHFLNLAYDDPAPLEGDGSQFALQFWDVHKAELMEGIEKDVRAKVQAEGGTFVGWDEADISAAIQETIRRTNTAEDGWLNSGGNTVFRAVLHNLEELDQRSTVPREALGRATGLCIPVVGTVLRRDTVPAIDRAFFIQARHELTPNVGLAVWYLRSVNDDTHTYAAAHGTGNDIEEFDHLANVIGIGAKWRFGPNASVSVDWGQNRTDLGRYLNGHTRYSHTSGMSDFTMLGRARGGTPRFWTIRFDIGHADTDRPGSWNAFADYKYFQHGSFFGGNGTEGVPDRYMDGIKSFTVGAGYVPAKDFLIEAFYTFDAKGIGKRDTLYGPESFKLGDYTRIQATYKF